MITITQIVTGVEVIIENFWPEVRNMLPEIEDRGQHVKGNMLQTKGENVQ